MSQSMSPLYGVVVQFEGAGHHQTLKVTPAMAAKVTPRLWEMLECDGRRESASYG
jgi:hypothetical protein